MSKKKDREVIDLGDAGPSVGDVQVTEVEGEITAFRFRLGEVVRDVVSGFVGAVMCQSMWITGGKRYIVQPHRLDRDGHMQTPELIHEDQLVSEGKTIELPRPKAAPAAPT